MLADNKSSLLYLVLLVLIPTLAISSSLSHHNHHYGFKSKHFTLYQHDIFNQTDFIVVVGVGGGANISISAPPFGTIGVLKNNLTLTPDPSSKVVGDVEGVLIVSSFDGQDSVSIGRIALNLKDGLSGTLSVVGVVNAINTSELPVTGGTGDFLLVQGYVTTTLVSLEVFTFVYKIDFHLYWPPYAPHAING